MFCTSAVVSLIAKFTELSSELPKTNSLAIKNSNPEIPKAGEKEKINSNVNSSTIPTTV